MAGLKEIKRRLKSVKNTKKITYAMKLVSAAKLRKAQDAVTSARAYTDALNSLLRKLNAERGSGADISHPLLQNRSESSGKVMLVVVGGSRGLCGPYNSGINKEIDSFYKSQSKQVDAILIGKKPAEYFRKQGFAYSTSYENLPEDANLWPVDEVCDALEKDFIDGKFDQAFMLYTKFKSALSMKAKIEQILPLSSEDISDGSEKELRLVPEGMTIFEPSVDEVFSAVIPRILRSKLRQAGLDAKASEHGSRMTAMDSATKNADELSRKLQLTHNRLRQSGITAELLDIIGGAEAIN